MNKRQIASWLMAGTLVVGGGIALAEGAPDDPSITVDETTPTTVDETTTTTEATTTTVEVATTTTLGLDGEDGESGVHPDNHGKVVSEAAHNHDMDEACGNHGKWVSSVAKGEESCAGLAGDVEAEADTDEVEDDSDEVEDGGGGEAEVESSGSGGRGHGRSGQG